MSRLENAVQIAYGRVMPAAETLTMPIPGHIDPVPVPRAQTSRADGRVELIGLDGLDRSEELVGDAGDRDVEDVDVLLPDQVQQQVQRPLEAVELDDQELLARDERAVRYGQIHRRMNQSAAPIR